MPFVLQSWRARSAACALSNPCVCAYVKRAQSGEESAQGHAAAHRSAICAGECATQAPEFPTCCSGKTEKKDKEKEKVERWELRDEVKQAIEKVGKDSAETIIQAAKDKNSKDDPNALPFELFLYDAAAKATNALWNSEMANLYQRRIFKGLSEDVDRPKLSEEIGTAHV